MSRCSSLLDAWHTAPLPPPKPLYPGPYPEKPPFLHLLPATLCLCPLPLAWQGQRVEALGPVSTHPFHIPNCHGRKRKQLTRKRSPSMGGRGGRGAQVLPHCCLSLGHLPYTLSNFTSRIPEERKGRPAILGRALSWQSWETLPQGLWEVARCQERSESRPL